MAKQKCKPKKARPGRVTRRLASTFGEESERLFTCVAEEALHGDRALFNDLTAHERGLVLQWLSEAIIDGSVENVVHDTLWEMDYVRKPVDIETFVKDDYYFGRICKDLHPFWIRDLTEVFGAGRQISEWILTGGIGTGKTTIAMTALGYKLHCMSCLRDPASYYGLLPDSLIIFGIYSITKKQVADTGYFKLRGWIDTSPYFRNDFPRSMKIDSKIDFKPAGQNLQVIPGCVAEGTPIATPDGDVPIEALVRTSPHVLTAENGRPCVSNYGGVADAGMKECVLVELEDGSHLTCSEDHGIHVWEAGHAREKKAKDIRQGDRVLGLSQRATPWGDALPEVSSDQSRVGVWDKDGSACGWSEESVQRALQAVRIQGGMSLLSGQQNREAVIRQAAALVVGMEGERTFPLEEVLRGEQGASSRSRTKCVLDARTNRSQEVTASAVVFKKCGACETVHQKVCEAAPGVGQGESASVCEDTEGSCAPKSCGSEARSAEACLAGRLVTFRYEDRLGILHTEMCLLWSSALPGELDVGSHSPVVAGWPNGVQEHGPSLHHMQQQEAYYERVGLHFDVAKRASKPSLQPNTRVVLLRVKDVRREGRRRCFDLIHVEKTHTYFAGGVLTKNSLELHALGLDLFSFCLSGNHHVWTERGAVKITDMLSKPERVWTFDGSNYYLTDPLHAKLTGCTRVIPVTLSSGQKLEATARHRWLVQDGAEYRWKRTGELCVGDLIVTPGQGKLDAGGDTDARVQAVREDAVLPDAALEARARDRRPGVPPEVSEREAVRSGAEQEGQGAEGCVSPVQALDAVHHAEALETTWDNAGGVRGEVSEEPTQGSGCAEEDERGGSDESERPVGRSEVREGVAEGNRKDASHLRRGPGVQGAEARARSRQQRDEVVSTLVGRQAVPESVRACARGCVRDRRFGLGVRTAPPDPVQGREREGTHVLPGLPGGDLSCGIQAESKTGCQLAPEAEGDQRTTLVRRNRRAPASFASSFSDRHNDQITLSPKEVVVL